MSSAKRTRKATTAEKDAASKKQAVRVAAHQVACIASAELVTFLCEINAGTIKLRERPADEPLSKQIQQWLLFSLRGKESVNMFDSLCSLVKTLFTEEAARVTRLYNLLCGAAGALRDGGDEASADAIQAMAAERYDEEVGLVAHRSDVFACLLEIWRTSEAFRTAGRPEYRPGWNEAYNAYDGLIGYMDRTEMSYDDSTEPGDRAMAGHIRRMRPLLPFLKTLSGR